MTINQLINRKSQFFANKNQIKASIVTMEWFGVYYMEVILSDDEQSDFDTISLISCKIYTNECKFIENMMKSE